MYRSMTKKMCAFCKELHSVLTSSKNYAKANICDKCVYGCDIAAENISPGVLVCRSCSSHDIYYVYNINSKFIKYEFKGYTLEGSGIYYPIQSNLNLSSGIKHLASRIICGACNRKNPLWFILYSKNLKQHFVIMDYD